MNKKLIIINTFLMIILLILINIVIYNYLTKDLITPYKVHFYDYIRVKMSINN